MLHDVFESCRNFRVFPCQDIIDSYSLHGLHGNRSRTQYHAFLLTELKISYIDQPVVSSKPEAPHRKLYMFSRMPIDMFQSEFSRLALQEVIRRIEITRETQINVDNSYDRLCDVILREMNENIPCYSPNKASRKRYKHQNPIGIMN